MKVEGRCWLEKTPIEEDSNFFRWMQLEAIGWFGLKKEGVRGSVYGTERSQEDNGTPWFGIDD